VECEKAGKECTPPPVEKAKVKRCGNCQENGLVCSIGRVIFHVDYIPSGRKALTVADLDGETQAEDTIREMEEAIDLLEGETEEYKEMVDKLSARMKLKDEILGKLDHYRQRVHDVLDRNWEDEVDNEEAITKIESFTQVIGQDVAEYEEDFGELDGVGAQ